MRVMTWKNSILLAVFTSLLALPSIAAAAPKVVILRDDVSPQAMLTQYGISAKFVYSNAVHGFAADLSPLTTAMLTADAEVVMVADDHTRSFASASLGGTRFRGNRYFGNSMEGSVAASSTGAATPIQNIPQVLTRGLRRIDGPLSKTARIDGIDQRVDADIAIIDSGVQPDQPDLNVVGGADCTGGNYWGDVEGHGTLVAGVAAAKDNKFGIVGDAPGARIWSVRVLDQNLQAEDSSVLCAIDWVTQHSGTIDVANMSLSGPGSDDKNCGLTNGDAIHYSICQSVKKGVVYVASAGNDGVDAENTIPAAYSEVISVSAMADSDGLKGGKGGPDLCEGYADDSFAPFSNYGRHVDLSAPGVCISSTYIGSDVATDSGTSFAAPFVSGAAALYLASDRGQRDLHNVRDAKRADRVRDELLDQREHSKLAGDPNREPEGIVNVKDL